MNLSILDRAQIIAVIETAGLRVDTLGSVWTTMWIAQATRPA